MRQTQTTSERSGSGALTSAWWLPVALGALSVVAGVVVLVRPHDLEWLAVVTGVFVLVDGIYEFVAASEADTEARGLVALMGVLCVIAGVLLVRHPGFSVTAVAMLLGLWLLATGAVRLAWTVTYDRRPASAVLGGVQVVGGIAILAVPGLGVATLAVLAAISLILYGVASIAVGLLGRERPALSVAVT